VPFRQEYVFRLQISVDDFLRVHAVEPLQNLRKDMQHLLFSQVVFACREVPAETALVRQVHHKVPLFFALLEKVHKLNDIVVLHLLHILHLAFHFCKFFLVINLEVHLGVNDLAGEQLLGFLVCALEDIPKAALA